MERRLNNAKINETILSQPSHKAQDAISLGKRVLKVTIKCHPSSTANVYVGWNQKANSGNLLQPGESATYHDERVYLDGNKLYVGFDQPNNTGGGMAIVSIISETDIENC